MLHDSLKLLILFIATSSFAQSNTEVYLADISISDEAISVSNVINVSNDPGYDNQPSFISNDILVFAGNNNGQTDIAKFDIKLNKKTWYHEGSASSQYSPQVIPNTSDLLAVHLDSTGYQRLFIHKDSDNSYAEAHPDLRIAYYALNDQFNMLATVLGDDDLDLVKVNLQTKETDTIIGSAGRSIHKIPFIDSMSYTVLNEEGNFDIYQYDMERQESFFVTELPIGIQDHIWLDDARILIGSGERLYLYDPFEGDEWREVGNLSAKGFKNITRLAISPDGKHIALSAEPID